VSRPRGRRRGLLVTSGGLAGAAASGAVVMVAVTGGAPAPAAPAASPMTTARVARTNLVTTVLTEGTLGYAASRPVVNQLTGTYTQLPRPGRRIGAGGTLSPGDHVPVVLMTGRTPAWRPMLPGITNGPDVAELERPLIALGYATSLLSTPSNVWTAATTAAVERWQHAAGLPVTGQVELGRVLFLPGPVRAGAPAVAPGDPAAAGQAPYQVTTVTRVITVPLNPINSPPVTLGDRVRSPCPLAFLRLATSLPSARPSLRAPGPAAHRGLPRAAPAPRGLPRAAPARPPRPC